MKVLVVEDDRKVAGFIEQGLREEGYVVDVALEGEQATMLAHVYEYDLMVLDVMLPKKTGLQLATELRREGRATPILMLTARDTTEDVVRGLDAGADDYLTKPFAMAELLVRVRALLRRAGRLTSGVLQVGDLIVDEGGRTVVRGDEPVDLTRTEFDLLLNLARTPGRVMSKSQLLSAVWGFDAYDHNLVEVHMSSLRRKLEAHGPRLVQTVRGAGYVLRA